MVSGQFSDPRCLRMFEFVSLNRWMLAYPRDPRALKCFPHVLCWNPKALPWRVPSLACLVGLAQQDWPGCRGKSGEGATAMIILAVT